MTNEAFHPDFTHLPAIAQDAARYFCPSLATQPSHLAPSASAKARSPEYRPAQKFPPKRQSQSSYEEKTKTAPDPFARPLKSTSTEEIQSSEVEEDGK